MHHRDIVREAFSFNREYDYVRLDGLSRATGRPAHEWDLYILKELIDNALDADESLWSKDLEQCPSLNIQMVYVKLADRQQLLVEVSNRTVFPVDQIEAIFDTRLYTSRKAFIKRLTRGALGNALKTLLGIPYSLHKRSAEEDEEGLQLKPLSISCNGMEYLPRYILDSAEGWLRQLLDVLGGDIVTAEEVGLTPPGAHSGYGGPARAHLQHRRKKKQKKRHRQ